MDNIFLINKETYKEYCKKAYIKTKEENKAEQLDKIIGVGEFLQYIGIEYDDIAGIFYMYKDKIINKKEDKDA